ncbi:SCO2400 family protein, partial [Streptomyces sp. KR55]|uniref:SCO2400 family protein n=1 Tax=Streptomyces sp. KR55 TaxID=3457425 RepID=UPI003FD032A0
MDYCHPCRRHLNGALACPGCGTPAEQLRAYAEETVVHTVVRTDVRTDVVTVVRPAEPDEPYDDGYDEEEGDAVDDGDRPGRGSGRRRQPAVSRRDRKAAAHRRRRRRTLLIAAGFLLAGGALSLAELGLDAPGSSPKPAAAGDASPDGGASEGSDESPDPLTDGSTGA